MRARKEHFLKFRKIGYCSADTVVDHRSVSRRGVSAENRDGDTRG